MEAIVEHLLDRFVGRPAFIKDAMRGDGETRAIVTAETVEVNGATCRVFGKFLDRFEGQNEL